jgi:hypothetical protein
LIRANDDGLTFDVGQHGEHSDGRSIEERGDEPLAVIRKRQANKSTWTLLQQGTTSYRCDQILVGFSIAWNGSNGLGRPIYLYKSPLFPDYVIKR